MLNIQIWNLVYYDATMKWRVGFFIARGVWFTRGGRGYTGAANPPKGMILFTVDNRQTLTTANLEYI